MGIFEKMMQNAILTVAIAAIVAPSTWLLSEQVRVKPLSTHLEALQNNGNDINARTQALMMTLNETQNELAEKNRTIEEFSQKQLLLEQESLIIDVDSEISSLQNEVDVLLNTVSEKNKIIEDFKAKALSQQDSSVSSEKLRSGFWVRNVEGTFNDCISASRNFFDERDIAFSNSLGEGTTTTQVFVGTIDSNVFKISCFESDLSINVGFSYAGLDADLVDEVLEDMKYVYPN